MKKRYLIILSVVLCAGLGLSSASATSLENDYTGPDFDDIGKTVESFTINTEIKIDDVTPISKDYVKFSAKVMTTNWFDKQYPVSAGQLVLYDKHHNIVESVDLSQNPHPSFCILFKKYDIYFLEYHGVTSLKDKYCNIIYNDTQRMIYKSIYCIKSIEE